MSENITGRVRLPQGFDSQAESIVEGTLVIEQGSLTFPDGTFFTSSIDATAFVTTSSFNAFTATYNSGSFSGSFRGDGSGLTGIAGGSINTGSLVTTSSFNSFTASINSFTASYSTGSFSGSFTGSLSGTSSRAINASSASVLDLYSLTLASNSYILFSNTIATTGAIVGGNNDLRYNSSTKVLSAVNISATNLTGSLLGTSSWAVNASTASLAPDYLPVASTSSMLSPYVLNSQTSSFVQNSQTSSFILNSQTSSMSVLSSSFATTASFVAGIYAFNYTASFTNQSTWTVNHNLGTRTVLIQAFDNNFQQIVPQNITLTDSNTATITFPTAETGFAAASVGGAYNIATASVATLATLATTASYVTGSVFNSNNPALSASFAVTSSYILNAVSSSFASTASFVTTAQTASYVLNAISSSFASTAASVTNLNQTLTIGNIISTPSTEATLNVYPPIVSGNGEGGQILLAASGGLYTSASMLDTYQNQFRLLKGTNTGGSTVAYIITDLQTGNTQFAGAVTASSYSGLPNSWLHALRSGNQSIGSGTWASRDIIFNDASSNNFTYNSSTGIATLRAGRTYRITARVAWAAAGVYVLQHRIYNQTTSAFVGPTAEMVQSSNGTNNISDGTLEHIFAVGASDVDISIRTTSATNALTGESIRGDLNTQLIIQQIA